MPPKSETDASDFTEIGGEWLNSLGVGASLEDFDVTNPILSFVFAIDPGRCACN